MAGADTFEEVDGRKVYYAKYGHGPHVLLCIPGAIGTSTSDFPHQIDGGLDYGTFTIIVIDLPGYGKSRPPERQYSKNIYKEDAKYAAGLMEKLGHKLYSVCGWSDGAKVALLLAIQYQARVEKLIMFGIIAFGTEFNVKAVGRTRNVNTVFDAKSRELYRQAYGQDLFEKLWHNHVDFVSTWIDEPEAYWSERENMRKIKCPTLILHGEKDPLVNKDHPYIVEEEIADSRLYKFPNGSHNIHMTFKDEFNRVITDFLTDE